MIEILTGEGKSIVIGICCAIFALVGFEVHSVCYSKYLSERDENKFKELFTFLGVEKNITYGTIKEISDLILYKSFDIRK